MTNLARDMRKEEASAPELSTELPPAAPPSPDPSIARIPSSTVHAFCETPAMVEVLESAAADRRMARADLTVRQGGVQAAVRLYRDTATPELIILESRAAAVALLADLEVLAEVCDPATKVIVIGESNDIALYRELLKRGISEYLRAPADPIAVISAIGGVFSGPEAAKLGRVYAFIGAKGGVGSSSVAHNAAWMLARHSGTDVILADMDLAFGSASLNFDLEAAGGIAEAVRDVDRLDDQMLERLLVKCDERLGLLAAPALLEATYDVDADAFEAVIECAQANAVHVVLDLPHIWSAWSRKTLLAADEVVITAAPDLANLRNAKQLVEELRKARPHDPAPKLVLNQVGMPKRPEIKPADFAEAVGMDPVIALPFDGKLFGAAANAGRMVADASARDKTAAAFRQLAESLGGRPMRRPRRFPGLGWLLGRRKASRA